MLFCTSLVHEQAPFPRTGVAEMTKDKVLSEEERYYFKQLVEAELQKRDLETASIKIVGLCVVFLYVVRAGIVAALPDVYGSINKGSNLFEIDLGLVVSRLMILAVFASLYFSWLNSPLVKYISIAAIAVATAFIWLDAGWIYLTFGEPKSIAFYVAFALRIICLAMLIWMHFRVSRRDQARFT